MFAHLVRDATQSTMLPSVQVSNQPRQGGASVWTWKHKTRGPKVRFKCAESINKSSNLRDICFSGTNKFHPDQVERVKNLNQIAFKDLDSEMVDSTCHSVLAPSRSASLHQHLTLESHARRHRSAARLSLTKTSTCPRYFFGLLSFSSCG